MSRYHQEFVEQIEKKDLASLKAAYDIIVSQVNDNIDLHKSLKPDILLLLQTHASLMPNGLDDADIAILFASYESQYGRDALIDVFQVLRLSNIAVDAINSEFKQRSELLLNYLIAQGETVQKEPSKDLHQLIIGNVSPFDENQLSSIFTAFKLHSGHDALYNLLLELEQPSAENRHLSRAVFTTTAQDISLLKPTIYSKLNSAPGQGLHQYIVALLTQHIEAVNAGELTRILRLYQNIQPQNEFLARIDALLHSNPSDHLLAKKLINHILSDKELLIDFIAHSQLSFPSNDINRYIGTLNSQQQLSLLTQLRQAQLSDLGDRTLERRKLLIKTIIDQWLKSGFQSIATEKALWSHSSNLNNYLYLVKLLFKSKAYWAQDKPAHIAFITHLISTDTLQAAHKLDLKADIDKQLIGLINSGLSDVALTQLFNAYDESFELTSLLGQFNQEMLAKVMPYLRQVALEKLSTLLTHIDVTGSGDDTNAKTINFSSLQYAELFGRYQNKEQLQVCTNIIPPGGKLYPSFRPAKAALLQRLLHLDKNAPTAASFKKIIDDLHVNDRPALIQHGLNHLKGSALEQFVLCLFNNVASYAPLPTEDLFKASLELLSNPDSNIGDLLVNYREIIGETDLNVLLLTHIKTAPQGRQRLSDIATYLSAEFRPEVWAQLFKQAAFSQQDISTLLHNFSNEILVSLILTLREAPHKNARLQANYEAVLTFLVAEKFLPITNYERSKRSADNETALHKLFVHNLLNDALAKDMLATPTCFVALFSYRFQRSHYVRAAAVENEWKNTAIAVLNASLSKEGIKAVALRLILAFQNEAIAGKTWKSLENRVDDLFYLYNSNKIQSLDESARQQILNICLELYDFLNEDLSVQDKASLRNAPAELQRLLKLKLQAIHSNPQGSILNSKIVVEQAYNAAAEENWNHALNILSTLKASADTVKTPWTAEQIATIIGRSEGKLNPASWQMFKTVCLEQLKLQNYSQFLQSLLDHFCEKIFSANIDTQIKQEAASLIAGLGIPKDKLATINQDQMSQVLVYLPELALSANNKLFIHEVLDAREDASALNLVVNTLGLTKEASSTLLSSIIAHPLFTKGLNIARVFNALNSSDPQLLSLYDDLIQAAKGLATAKNSQSSEKKVFLSDVLPSLGNTPFTLDDTVFEIHPELLLQLADYASNIKQLFNPRPRSNDDTIIRALLSSLSVAGDNAHQAGNTASEMAFQSALEMLILHWAKSANNCLETLFDSKEIWTYFNRLISDVHISEQHLLYRLIDELGIDFVRDLIDAPEKLEIDSSQLQQFLSGLLSERKLATQLDFSKYKLMFDKLPQDIREQLAEQLLTSDDLNQWSVEYQILLARALPPQQLFVRYQELEEQQVLFSQLLLSNPKSYDTLIPTQLQTLLTHHLNNPRIIGELLHSLCKDPMNEKQGIIAANQLVEQLNTLLEQSEDYNNLEDWISKTGIDENSLALLANYSAKDNHALRSIIDDKIANTASYNTPFRVNLFKSYKGEISITADGLLYQYLVELLSRPEEIEGIDDRTLLKLCHQLSAQDVDRIVSTHRRIHRTQEQLAGDFAPFQRKSDVYYYVGSDEQTTDFKYHLAALRWLQRLPALQSLLAKSPYTQMVEYLGQLPETDERLAVFTKITAIMEDIASVDLSQYPQLRRDFSKLYNKFSQHIALLRQNLATLNTLDVKSDVIARLIDQHQDQIIRLTSHLESLDNVIRDVSTSGRTHGNLHILFKPSDQNGEYTRNKTGGVSFKSIGYNFVFEQKSQDGNSQTQLERELQAASQEITQRKQNIEQQSARIIRSITQLPRRKAQMVKILQSKDLLLTAGKPNEALIVSCVNKLAADDVSEVIRHHQARMRDYHTLYELLNQIDSCRRNEADDANIPMQSIVKLLLQFDNQYYVQYGSRKNALEALLQLANDANASRLATLITFVRESVALSMPADEINALLLNHEVTLSNELNYLEDDVEKIHQHAAHRRSIITLAHSSKYTAPTIDDEISPYQRGLCTRQLDAYAKLYHDLLPIEAVSETLRSYTPIILSIANDNAQVKFANKSELSPLHSFEHCLSAVLKYLSADKTNQLLGSLGNELLLSILKDCLSGMSSDDEPRRTSCEYLIEAIVQFSLDHKTSASIYENVRELVGKNAFDTIDGLKRARLAYLKKQSSIDQAVSAEDDLQAVVYNAIDIQRALMDPLTVAQCDNPDVLSQLIERYRQYSLLLKKDEHDNYAQKTAELIKENKAQIKQLKKEALRLEKNSSARATLSADDGTTEKKLKQAKAKIARLEKANTRMDEHRQAIRRFKVENTTREVIAQLQSKTEIESDFTIKSQAEANLTNYLQSQLAQRKASLGGRLCNYLHEAFVIKWGDLDVSESWFLSMLKKIPHDNLVTRDLNVKHIPDTGMEIFDENGTLLGILDDRGRLLVEDAQSRSNYIFNTLLSSSALKHLGDIATNNTDLLEKENVEALYQTLKARIIEELSQTDAIADLEEGDCEDIAHYLAQIIAAYDASQGYYDESIEDKLEGVLKQRLSLFGLQSRAQLGMALFDKNKHKVGCLGVDSQLVSDNVFTENTELRMISLLPLAELQDSDNAKNIEKLFDHIIAQKQLDSLWLDLELSFTTDAKAKQQWVLETVTNRLSNKFIALDSSSCEFLCTHLDTQALKDILAFQQKQNDVKAKDSALTLLSQLLQHPKHGPALVENDEAMVALFEQFEALQLSAKPSAETAHDASTWIDTLKTIAHGKKIAQLLHAYRLCQKEDYTDLLAGERRLTAIEGQGKPGAANPFRKDVLKLDLSSLPLSVWNKLSKEVRYELLLSPVMYMGLERKFDSTVESVEEKNDSIREAINTLQQGLTKANKQDLLRYLLTQNQNSVGFHTAFTHHVVASSDAIVAAIIGLESKVKQNQLLSSLFSSASLHTSLEHLLTNDHFIELIDNELILKAIDLYNTKVHRTPGYTTLLKTLLDKKLPSIFETNAWLSTNLKSALLTLFEDKNFKQYAVKVSQEKQASMLNQLLDSAAAWSDSSIFYTAQNNQAKKLDITKIQRVVKIPMENHVYDYFRDDNDNLQQDGWASYLANIPSKTMKFFKGLVSGEESKAANKENKQAWDQVEYYTIKSVDRYLMKLSKCTASDTTFINDYISSRIGNIEHKDLYSTCLLMNDTTVDSGVRAAIFDAFRKNSNFASADELAECGFYDNKQALTELGARKEYDKITTLCDTLLADIITPVSAASRPLITQIQKDAALQKGLDELYKPANNHWFKGIRKSWRKFRHWCDRDGKIDKLVIAYDKQATITSVNDNKHFDVADQQDESGNKSNLEIANALIADITKALRSDVSQEEINCLVNSVKSFVFSSEIDPSKEIELRQNFNNLLRELRIKQGNKWKGLCARESGVVQIGANNRARLIELYLQTDDDGYNLALNALLEECIELTKNTHSRVVQNAHQQLIDHVVPSGELEMKLSSEQIQALAEKLVQELVISLPAQNSVALGNCSVEQQKISDDTNSLEYQQTVATY